MELVMVFAPMLVMFLIGLLFVLIAVRLATRVVLDEIAKDRARRGRI